jgi:hypothetical protein
MRVINEKSHTDAIGDGIGLTLIDPSVVAPNSLHAAEMQDAPPYADGGSSAKARGAGGQVIRV